METISADIVWGLAMRAQTTNNGYVKTAVIDESTNQVITTPNHVLVKSWLQSNQVPTQLEIDQGNECRSYIKGFIFKQLDDTITDFECTALKVADIDWFKTSQLREFSLISSLPMFVSNSMDHPELDNASEPSIAMSNDVGESIVGDVVILSSNFYTNFDKFKIKGQIGESIVDFWFKTHMDVGATYHLRARIKTKRPNGTTQLNFVALA